MTQVIVDPEKMKYYNQLPPEYLPPDHLKRMIGEDEQCQMCWNPFMDNWCDYCYHPSDEKTVIIINKSTLPWTINIDAGSSGMQNRGKSGRLGKGKAKNSNFKNQNKRRIKKRKESQQIQENF